MRGKKLKWIPLKNGKKDSRCREIMEFTFILCFFKFIVGNVYLQTLNEQNKIQTKTKNMFADSRSEFNEVLIH